MANTDKTIKIKFDGTTKGLDKSAKDAERIMTRFGKNVSSGIAKVTSKLPDMLSGVIGSLPPQGQAIALAITGGLAVALSSVIGAAITSAVLLAVGGGVLALGIKAAIDNPKVTKAFDGLKKKATKIFEEFGKPFEKPLIRAAKTFGKALDQVRPTLVRLGELVAPLIDKLAPAVSKFLTNALPGIEKAVEASIPLFETLAETLPGIGEAVSQFFGEIAKGGPGANKFFKDLMVVIGGTIIVAGKLIGSLASLYASIRNGLATSKVLFLQFTSYVIGLFQKLLSAAVLAFGWMPGIGPKLKEAQKKFSDFRAGVNNELNKIHDKNVKINVWSNVGAVAASVANTLANLKGIRIPGRASGGPVSAGRTYLVGEKGPELLTMGGNGHVTPNHELGDNSSGGDYYAVIDLGRGVQEVIKLEFRQLKRELQAA